MVLSGRRQRLLGALRGQPGQHDHHRRRDDGGLPHPGGDRLRPGPARSRRGPGRRARVLCVPGARPGAAGGAGRRHGAPLRDLDAGDVRLPLRNHRSGPQPHWRRPAGLACRHRRGFRGRVHRGGRRDRRSLAQAQPAAGGHARDAGRDRAGVHRDDSPGRIAWHSLVSSEVTSRRAFPSASTASLQRTICAVPLPGTNASPWNTSRRTASVS